MWGDLRKCHPRTRMKRNIRKLKNLIAPQGEDDYLFVMKMNAGH
ncbi:hypothetical protein BN1012_Phect207 [Candidatus Phaeomarinobacter ectocarpi]|uniref:Uncharacterized protein n=1 Tax=Candidatus Phaeomarinibacter ectocarpi TaxID=1458461 RepID=X5MLI0_9HYPH|nr:hypothetical protein BN1012_Phect207 [Candidatus Phaeomarinobacter ectocarpi]